MDNNKESSELMSANSDIQERGLIGISNFYVHWAPARSNSSYDVSLTDSPRDSATNHYNLPIGQKLEYVMLPNRGTGTLVHEAIPNEPKRLGKLSLILDGRRNPVNYRG